MKNILFLPFFSLFVVIVTLLIRNFLVLSDIRCPYVVVDQAQNPTGTCTNPDGSTATDLIYQTTCSFECMTGRERVGSEHITCQLSGEWSPDPPECECKKFFAQSTTSRTEHLFLLQVKLCISKQNVTIKTYVLVSIHDALVQILRVIKFSFSMTALNSP